jgi:hypothetical protein
MVSGRRRNSSPPSSPTIFFYLALLHTLSDFIFLSSYIKSILRKKIAQFRKRRSPVFLRIPCREKKTNSQVDLMGSRTLDDESRRHLYSKYCKRLCSTCWNSLGLLCDRVVSYSSFSRAFLFPFFVGLLS